MNRLFDICC